MKKIFLLGAFIATAFIQQTFAQDSTKTQASPLLTSYYALKDALVSSNSNAAATNAGEFIKAADALELQDPLLEVRLYDVPIVIPLITPPAPTVGPAGEKE